MNSSLRNSISSLITIARIILGFRMEDTAYGYERQLQYEIFMMVNYKSKATCEVICISQNGTILSRENM
jgi:hypothetical protein